MVVFEIKDMATATEKIRPKVGLAVLIFNNKNQLLFMKRQGSHGAGTWCPPGGHLETGESFLECAKKECKKEVDLDIKEISILGITNDIPSLQNHYVTIQTKAIEWEGKPQIIEPEKCSEIGWFGLKDLPEPLFDSPANAIKYGILKI